MGELDKLDAVKSLREEQEAIRNYTKREDEVDDPALRRVISHALGEERGHAAGFTQWIRGSKDMEIATDPPVSEQQRKAMWAAKAGNSTLGIPKSVGEEFANADPGGKLPARAKDMGGGDWRGLIRGLLKFFMEEEREPEHQEGEGEDEPAAHGAGVMFHTPAGDALFVKRSGTGDHEGEWCFPGGSAEGDESPEECARREAVEEVGDCTLDGMMPYDARVFDGVGYHTFRQAVDRRFKPVLNDESTEAIWAPLTKPPLPLHPGAKATIDAMLEGDAEPGKLSETTREKIGDPGSEKREDMPESVFLMPSERKYPVKIKEGGQWRYTRSLLLAAERRAILEHKPDIAARAKAILKSEFGEDEEKKDAEDGRAHDFALALDKDPNRQFDKDGRLHVSSSNITKETISPYLGEEIPGWEKLGLDPKKTYHLYRSGEELKKSVDTWNGVPLLFRHEPTSAADHPADITIGALGTDAKWNPPYLQNSLTIWPQYAISAVENGDQQELSGGYSYTPDLTPGTWNGQHFDGVMRNIIGNHVALVSKGRAGSDIKVGDSAMSYDAEWRRLEEAITDL